MIIRQYEKPYVPEFARYDYVQVYDWQGRFIGWHPIYQEIVVNKNYKRKEPEK